MKTYITEAIERFDEKFVENTDNMAVIRIIRQQQAGSIEQFFIKELEKVAKMFGGCTKCYGKGYGTTTTQYSEGDGFRKWTEQEMDFCSCDRGKQLEKLCGKR